MDRENLAIFKKTGAGEGIRTLDPNLGKIQLYEISVLNQVLIKLLKNPNTIRTFLKAVRLECFVLNVLVAALRPTTVNKSASWLPHKRTLHGQD